MTSLKELQKLGAFVQEAPVAKEITFKSEGGEVVSAGIYVRQLGVADYESLFAGESAASRSYSAMAIHVGIRLGGGDEVIPYDMAARLDKSLAKAMIDAFNEVNGPKKASANAKNSSAT